MLVAFRADASVQIGTGHVMRCLTLADELAGLGHHCLFICRDHEGHLGELIQRKGFELCMLKNHVGLCSESGETGDSQYSEWLGVSWEKDSKETQELLAGRKASWVVVDHYALDVRWEREIAEHSEQIMVIDDLADREHDCAVLLDQNLGRFHRDYNGLVPSQTLRLIGPHYALLRSEFHELRGEFLERRQAMQCRRILISLGGVDQTNVTSQVLSALESSSLPSSAKLDIVLSSSAPALEEVRYKAVHSRFEVAVNVNVTNMAERMCWADLSIGAAGSTSWERCCLGLPAVLVVLAQNQVAGAAALEASGAAIKIDDTKQLHEAFRSLWAALSDPSRLERMSKAAAAITDGLGVSRVVQAMNVAGSRDQ
ncbi:UDP-2,4-diacetamido-2,4,6-trideoxy-beta-L-altropyranose hydrolase [Marinobacter sp. es.042]|uniref:UDP-2,4-diacetamido-2,4, 6-trideoxy-beta-L-altropyranose hydrolase n=1 Tax=Marinobacter sp. es.042 TaxID=1761794 RepID=UPI000B4FD79B|nr:UDP-2,4-diacetamido-2,4,6-trideoxy-beta-L-altropyranose hydrolase [Marinobacter sp. es.042]SNB54883.1 UDP-2,4-diacetamido-2,4,6-trideoxy-beta-L-altropyranose hydrolase [Marinobacter sp. es.042]